MNPTRSLSALLAAVTVAACDGRDPTSSTGEPRIADGPALQVVFDPVPAEELPLLIHSALSNMWWIDLKTGQPTLIGPTGYHTRDAGLTVSRDPVVRPKGGGFDARIFPAGTVFGLFRRNERDADGITDNVLMVIDPETGAAEVVADSLSALLIPNRRGLSFRPDSGFYFVQNNTAGSLDATGLRKYNPFTEEITIVGGASPPCRTPMHSLEYDPDTGKFYSIDGEHHLRAIHPDSGTCADLGVMRTVAGDLVQTVFSGNGDPRGWCSLARSPRTGRWYAVHLNKPGTASAETNIYSVAIPEAVIGPRVFHIPAGGYCGSTFVAPILTAVAEGPSETIEGTLETFDGSQSSDPDGQALTHLWQFGDGSGSTVASPKHAFADDGTYQVTLTVTNQAGFSATKTLTVTVLNAKPVVDAGGDAHLNVGETLQRSGSFSDPGADTWTATVDYGDGSGAIALPLTGKSFQLAHNYVAGGPYTVTVTVTDDDGGVGTAAFAVALNPGPVFSLPTLPEIPEGSLFQRAVSFTDPGSTSWTGTVDYGDGAGPEPLTLNINQSATGGSFAISHAYADDGVYPLVVRLEDGTGAATTETVDVTVVNVVPVVTLTDSNGLTLREGGVFLASGSFTDPGADSWTATVQWGDGAGEVFDPASPNIPINLSHRYRDDGQYPVTLEVTDDDGGVGSATLVVTVANVAPLVSAGPDGREILSGETFTLFGDFRDPGDDAPWAWTVDWDGSTDAGLAQSPGPLTVTRRFLEARAYHVAFTVTDKDGASGSAGLALTVRRIRVELDFLAPVLSLNRAGGYLWVAVLSDSRVDAREVNPATVTLGDGSGPAAPVARNKAGNPIWKLSDLDRDGDVDAMLAFEVADLRSAGVFERLAGSGPSGATLRLVLLGDMADGRQVAGSGAITVRGRLPGRPARP